MILCDDNESLFALFESLVKGRSGLLLLYRPTGLLRKILTLHSLDASQATVDQALSNLEFCILSNPFEAVFYLHVGIQNLK